MPPRCTIYAESRLRPVPFASRSSAFWKALGVVGVPISFAGRMSGRGVRRDKAALSRSYRATGAVPLRFRFAKHELNGDRDVDLSAGACRPRRDCHAFCRV